MNAGTKLQESRSERSRLEVLCRVLEYYYVHGSELRKRSVIESLPGFQNLLRQESLGVLFVLRLSDSIAKNKLTTEPT